MEMNTQIGNAATASAPSMFTSFLIVGTFVIIFVFGVLAHGSRHCYQKGQVRGTVPAKFLAPAFSPFLTQNDTEAFESMIVSESLTLRDQLQFTVTLKKNSPIQ